MCGKVPDARCFEVRLVRGAALMPALLLREMLFIRPKLKVTAATFYAVSRRRRIFYVLPGRYWP